MEQIFPELGIWRRDDLRCCPLEHFQVKTVDLLKSHFGTALRESFTLLAGSLIEDCSLFSGWISFYRIKKYTRPDAEIPMRVVA